MCVCIYPFLSLFSFYTSFFYLILGSFQIKIKTYYYSLLSLLYYLGCNTLHKCSYKKEIELFLWNNIILIIQLKVELYIDKVVNYNSALGFSHISSTVINGT